MPSGTFGALPQDEKGQIRRSGCSQTLQRWYGLGLPQMDTSLLEGQEKWPPRELEGCLQPSEYAPLPIAGHLCSIVGAPKSAILDSWKFFQETVPPERLYNFYVQGIDYSTMQGG